MNTPTTTPFATGNPATNFEVTAKPHEPPACNAQEVLTVYHDGRDVEIRIPCDRPKSGHRSRHHFMSDDQKFECFWSD